MPTIHLTTFIAAPIDRVFDLSRSIDLHKASMKKYGEASVQGTTFGLMGAGETVTWRAKHLFKERFLKVKLTFLKKPTSFIDELVEGDFKMMKHEHHFKPCENGTIMIDLVEFEAPYGSFGKLFSKLYLTGYVKNLIEHRNKAIKEFAEGEKWRKILNK